MTVNKTVEGTKLTMAISGRVDTTTAPVLEKEIKDSISGIEQLVLNFSKVEYISSAGLRVLLVAQKTMIGQGSMKLTGVSADIMEILEITGFSSVLTIE